MYPVIVPPPSRSSVVQAATYGLRVGRHNHGHELRSSIGGRTALEVFADLLDPTVAFEVDL